jgi:hypothetical protein
MRARLINARWPWVVPTIRSNKLPPPALAVDGNTATRRQTGLCDY